MQTYIRKLSSSLALSLLLLLTQGEARAYSGYTNAGKDATLPYIVSDLILLRPFGLVLTIAGTGLFVVTSPFIGMANIAPPHNAFNKAADVLIMAPVGFTFERPLGLFGYEPTGRYSTSLPEPANSRVPLPSQQISSSPSSRQ